MKCGTLTFERTGLSTRADDSSPARSLWHIPLWAMELLKKPYWESPLPVLPIITQGSDVYQDTDDTKDKEQAFFKRT